MMSVIKRNKIVFLDLTVLDENAAVVETTDGQNAFCYLHGRGNLLPALEEVLEGQQEGYEAKLSLPPEKAFGMYTQDLVLQIPKQQLTVDVELVLGECVQAQGPNGMMRFEIKAIEGDQVRLDANHPLAGKTLTFMLKVLAVRDAHKDEVKHRRPHPGGHHLMVSDSSWWTEE